METTEVADDDKAAANLHDLLLRLAGEFPDPFLVQCRSWLAEQELGRLVSSLCLTIVTTGIPLFDDEIALLSDVLARDGADPRVVEAIGRNADDVEDEPLCYFSVDPEAAEAVWAGEAPETVDAPETVETDGATKVAGDVAAAAPDEAPAGAAARALVAAPVDAIVDAAGRAHLIGVWRTWRSPLPESPWFRPRWVYLLEVSPDTPDRAAVTGRVQRALAVTGETAPLVETFTTVQALPLYQRLALTEAELIWASTPDRVPTMVTIFDAVDLETGPSFADDHPRFYDPGEIEAIVKYLDAGELVVDTTARMPDVTDPDRPLTVPMGLRSDGVWIWPDAVQYYLTQYGLAPDFRLLRHMSEVDYRPAQLTLVDVHRVMRVLRRPMPAEPIWQYELG